MSYGILVALGLETPSKKKLETDWKPPSKSGLENSNRIIPIKSVPGNEFKIQFADKKSNNDENDDDDDEEEDDDDDDWSDEEEDEDDDIQIPSIVMSANLMKALGMDISGIDTTTDWKPPAFTGVANSERIIK